MNHPLAELTAALLTKLSPTYLSRALLQRSHLGPVTGSEQRSHTTLPLPDAMQTFAHNLRKSPTDRMRDKLVRTLFSRAISSKHYFDETHDEFFWGKNREQERYEGSCRGCD